MIASIAVGVLITTSACTAGPSGGTEEGGAISIAIVEPDHITPGWTFGGPASWVVPALWAPLARINPDGTISNEQAESIESDDYRVWTVTIKPDWTFHNEDPITAQDYVNTINTAALGANAWGNNYQTQEIEGYGDLNPAEGEATATELSGLRVIDDLTFEITLTTANSEFPYKLTYLSGPYVALPEAAFDDLAAFDEAPIGSGPFQIDGVWEHNSQIHLTAWEDYQGTKPNVTDLTYKIYLDAQSAFTDFEAGNVDITGAPAYIPTGRFESLKSDVGDDNVLVATSVDVQWLGFSNSDPRLADPDVRRAIAIAIDRAAISENIYGGLYEAPTGLFPPGIVEGGTENCGDNCAYDPDRAVELLEEAGGFGGDLEIHFPTGFDLEPLYEAVANSVNQTLGINVVLDPYTSTPAFFEEMAGPDVTGMMWGTWGSPTPIGSDVLNGVFKTTAQYNSLAGQNKSAEVDALIAQAAQSDEAQRTEIVGEIEQTILDDMWVTPLVWNGTVFAYGDRVHNMTSTPWAGLGYDLREITVSE